MSDQRALYDLAKRRAGMTASKQDHKSYILALRDVMAVYRGQKQGFERCMKEVYRRCADAAGFPDYERWVELQIPSPSSVGASET